MFHHREHGVTAAVVTLPLTMAMGVTSGVGSIAGVVIMLTVLIITVAVDLLLTVGIGMVMTRFLFMKRITDIQIDSMKTITRPGDNSAYERALSQQEAKIMKQANGQIIVLDLSNVPSVDFTSSRALEDIITDTIEAGQKMILLGVCEQVHKILEQQGALNYLDEGNVFSQRIDALQPAQQLLNN